MIVAEGNARIGIEAGNGGKVSRAMPVFYNPAMRLNRDVSVLLLKSTSNNKLKMADPLAASGVRSIRFLLELPKPKVKEIVINDASTTAIANVKRNLRLNKLSSDKRITVANGEANLFLLKNRGFDYIDLDPFGTPVTFLDSAARRLSRNGILAVTATDTAALSGTSPSACMRKYFAVPLRNFMMHELGLRILIRRVQLAAATHGKALTPVYSYSKRHYMRAFFRCSCRKEDVDKVLKLHKRIVYCRNCFTTTTTADKLSNNDCSSCGSRKVEIAGPLWVGKLWDSKLAAAIARNNEEEGNAGFLKTISRESRTNSFGFFDTHFLCKKLGLNVPPLAKVVADLKKRGYNASRTHFSGNGIRASAPTATIVSIVKKQA